MHSRTSKRSCDTLLPPGADPGLVPSRLQTADSPQGIGKAASVRVILHWALIGGLVAVLAGCRAHPASLAITLVGDAINDSDVQSRSPELIGRPPAAADTMFGPRLDSLRTLDGTKTLAVYPVRGDALSKSRWVVEIENQRITALSKALRQADGAEDVIKEALLQEKLIGRSPEQFRAEPGFDQPVLTASRESTYTLVRLYDVRNWTNLRGARYCVLEFDPQNRCREVRLVGIDSSSTTHPATATRPGNQ